MEMLVNVLLQIFEGMEISQQDLKFYYNTNGELTSFFQHLRVSYKFFFFV